MKLSSTQPHIVGRVDGEIHGRHAHIAVHRVMENTKPLSGRCNRPLAYREGAVVGASIAPTRRVGQQRTLPSELSVSVIPHSEVNEASSSDVEVIIDGNRRRRRIDGQLTVAVLTSPFASVIEWRSCPDRCNPLPRAV